MTTLSSKINFSDKKENSEAVKINKWHNVNHYETLCLYCANNDINFYDVSDDDFLGCSEVMAEYGQDDKSIDYYYFWIDKD